jgi:hypothetical protein
MFILNKIDEKKILSLVVVNFGTDATRNRPGLLNPLNLNVQINKVVGDPQSGSTMARIKVILTSPW